MSLDRYLRLPEVLHVTGLSRTTIWEREKAGTFPVRTRLGGKAVGWRESQIQAWLTALEAPAAEPTRRRRQPARCICAVPGESDVCPACSA